MPTLLFGHRHAGVLGLLVLALAAPAAHAQQHSRWQVEVSLGRTGPDSLYTLVLDGPAGGHEVSQRQSIGYSIAATRLAGVAPRTSLRFGLSLANKGYAERSIMLTAAPRTPGTPSYYTGGPVTRRRVDVVYLGAPLTLGYNLVNARRGVLPFVEAGVAPELLVWRDRGELEFDLRGAGLSYLLSLGLKYNLRDGRALVLAPEARLPATEYSRSAAGELEYQPATIGIKLGVQF